MHILAIDTSRTPGSAAILEDTKLVRELIVPTTGKTTQQLFPDLRSLLAEVNWRPRDVELLAVTLGPGSFTGLRIGVTLAKLWTYASPCSLVALETLDVLAAQAQSPAAVLEVVMYAERGQLFHARFKRVVAITESVGDESERDLLPSSDFTQQDSPWRRVTETRVVDQGPWLAQLAPGTAVLGDGLEKLRAPLPDGILVEPPEAWRLRASTLGRLAFHAHHRGEDVDPWTILPKYGRPSAAEEKRQRLQQEPSGQASC